MLSSNQVRELRAHIQVLERVPGVEYPECGIIFLPMVSRSYHLSCQKRHLSRRYWRSMLYRPGAAFRRFSGPRWPACSWLPVTAPHRGQSPSPKLPDFDFFDEIIPKFFFFCEIFSMKNAQFRVRFPSKPPHSDFIRRTERGEVLVCS